HRVFMVEASGKAALGPEYGRVEVQGRPHSGTALAATLGHGPREPYTSLSLVLALLPEMSESVAVAVAPAAMYRPPPIPLPSGTPPMARLPVTRARRSVRVPPLAT